MIRPVLTRFNHIDAATIIISSVIALLSVLALFSFMLDYTEYRFGTEVSGYAYTSIYHYLGVNVVIVSLWVLLLFSRTSIAKVMYLLAQLVVIAISYLPA
jgi:hypothetical protein